MSDPMLQRRQIAEIIDPIAFDRAAFNASATIFTMPGDFERRQARALSKAIDILLLLDRKDT